MRGAHCNAVVVVVVVVVLTAAVGGDAAGVLGELAGVFARLLELEAILAKEVDVPVDVAYAVELLHEKRADGAVEREAEAVLELGLLLFGAARHRQLAVDHRVHGRYELDEAGERGETGKHEYAARYEEQVARALHKARVQVNQQRDEHERQRRQDWYDAHADLFYTQYVHNMRIPLK